MSERVLIAYGSKHGSTAETADAIGGMLREHGLEVDVSEAARVQSLEGYDCVVLPGGKVSTPSFSVKSIPSPFALVVVVLRHTSCGAAPGTKRVSKTVSVIL